MLSWEILAHVMAYIKPVNPCHNTSWSLLRYFHSQLSLEHLFQFSLLLMIHFDCVKRFTWWRNKLAQFRRFLFLFCTKSRTTRVIILTLSVMQHSNRRKCYPTAQEDSNRLTFSTWVNHSAGQSKCSNIITSRVVLSRILPRTWVVKFIVEGSYQCS